MDLLLLTLVKTVFMDLLLNSTTIPISKSIYNIEISDESVEAERNVVTIQDKYKFINDISY